MMRKESDTRPVFACVICKEDKSYCAMGSCEHHKVCLYCTMKSRLLYCDNRCPICHTKLDYIFILEFQNLIPLEQLEKEKDLYYQDDEFDKSGIYYVQIESKEEALRLRGFNCPIFNCKSETFENLETLHKHLNKKHNRFYCDCCLKENKKFLAEMVIYTENQLQDHIKYGEYSKGSLLSPPHPKCPFDHERFYDDEKLFKHMNQTHFVCQICRDQKNIIFYSILDNLLEHYKSKHFCCPFSECIQDIYVVFQKEEELLSHFISKHKMVDANDRLTQIVMEHKKVNKEGYNKFRSKDEFDFTRFVMKLKEKSEEYRDSLANNKKYIYTQEETSTIGDDGIEYIVQYENNDKYNKRGRGRYNNRKKGKYYNNNNGNSGYNRYDNNYYQGKKNYYNNQQGYKDNSNKYNNSNIGSFNSISSPIGNTIQSPTESSHINEANLDYSFILNYYLKSIKEYLKIKILVDKADEEQFTLPKERTYQLIIIIDKLDSYYKLLELSKLHNFGIDMEIVKELKDLLCRGECDNNKLYDILNGISIQKVLIIYKYIQISSQKVDHLFYKFELQQINDNLYEEFVERKRKNINSSEKNVKKIVFLNQFGSVPIENPPSNKKQKGKQSTRDEIKEEKFYEKKKENPLSMLFDNPSIKKKISNNPQKNKQPTIFNLSNFNYDEDFPAFH